MDNTALEVQPNIVSDALTESLLEAIDSEEVSELGINADDKFTIQTKEQAEYLVKTYKKLLEEVENVNKTAKEYISKHKEKAEKWQRAEIRKREGTMCWFETRLRAYAEKQLEGTKKRSLNMIEGTLGFRKNESVEYDDEELLNYLKVTAPNYLEQPPLKIKKAELKKNGEFRNGKFILDDKEVPGVMKIVLPDNFAVK